MLHNDLFLLLGSNLGDRLDNLEKSQRLIQNDLGSISKRSSIYETEPWGKTDQPNYFNQVIQISSSLEPYELLIGCLAIEKKLGRQRDKKWESRTIDIDIIYFNNQIVNSSELVIPHPRIAERRFVLVPLAEISPDFVHPVLLKTNQLLLAECIDPLLVKRLRGMKSA